MNQPNAQTYTGMVSPLLWGLAFLSLALSVVQVWNIISAKIKDERIPDTLAQYTGLKLFTDDPLMHLIIFIGAGVVAASIIWKFLMPWVITIGAAIFLVSGYGDWYKWGNADGKGKAFLQQTSTPMSQQQARFQQAYLGEKQANTRPNQVASGRIKINLTSAEKKWCKEFQEGQYTSLTAAEHAANTRNCARGYYYK